MAIRSRRASDPKAPHASESSRPSPPGAPLARPGRTGGPPPPEASAWPILVGVPPRDVPPGAVAHHRGEGRIAGTHHELHPRAAAHEAELAERLLGRRVEHIAGDSIDADLAQARDGGTRDADERRRLREALDELAPALPSQRLDAEHGAADERPPPLHLE